MVSCLTVCYSGRSYGRDVLVTAARLGTVLMCDILLSGGIRLRPYEEY